MRAGNLHFVVTEAFYAAGDHAGPWLVRLNGSRLKLRGSNEARFCVCQAGVGQRSFVGRDSARCIRPEHAGLARKDRIRYARANACLPRAP